MTKYIVTKYFNSFPTYKVKIFNNIDEAKELCDKLNVNKTNNIEYHIIVYDDPLSIPKQYQIY